MTRKQNRKWKTAAEFMADLRADPEWVRQHEERQARQQAVTEKLRKDLEPEETPLLAELANLGLAVNSVWDLVNSRARYPEAIPTLTKYLSMSQHPVLRQGIARALTVPEAQGIAGNTLLEELASQKDPPGSEERWALANALTVAGDKSMADRFKLLIADPSYEDVHERLTMALKNTGAR